MVGCVGWSPSYFVWGLGMDGGYCDASFGGVNEVLEFLACPSGRTVQILFPKLENLNEPSEIEKDPVEQALSYSSS